MITISKHEITDGKPTNYEELKKKANDSESWRNRLEAVKELKKWKCRESKDILWQRMISDEVPTVREAAFRGLQGFGENVKLSKKKKGKLIKDINKRLQKVRSSFGEEDFSFNEFKEKFKVMYPSVYDTYEGNKKSKFEEWLKNSMTSLPKK